MGTYDLWVRVLFAGELLPLVFFDGLFILASAVASIYARYGATTCTLLLASSMICYGDLKPIYVDPNFDLFVWPMKSVLAPFLLNPERV